MKLCCLRKVWGHPKNKAIKTLTLLPHLLWWDYTSFSAGKGAHAGVHLCVCVCVCVSKRVHVCAFLSSFALSIWVNHLGSCQGLGKVGITAGQHTPTKTHTHTHTEDSIEPPPGNICNRHRPKQASTPPPEPSLCSLGAEEWTGWALWVREQEQKCLRTAPTAIIGECVFVCLCMFA